jgi:uncharacterized protein with PQ loop repeat
MISLLGILGSLFFAICALPQVIQVWKTQDTTSISKMFLIFWALGEVLSFVYVICQSLILWPIICNYVFNGIMLGYLLYKKFTEKKNA